MKLHSTVRALAATALILGLGLTVSASAGASARHHDDPIDFASHALFLETDATANAVISYQRASDGTISYAGTYATGGEGATAANATADPLSSQGGLALLNDNTELAAVNAGSDTVSLFAVFGTTLHLIEQVPSGGLFPDSIASHGDLVAVLNAGGTGTVTQYRLIGGLLVALPNDTRSLGFANTNPPDYVHGPGQVGYSPNGQWLIVTTKLSSNSYDVFSVAPNGTLASAPVVSAADNAVPYSFTFDAAGNLVATEASNSSVSVYEIGATGKLTSLGTVSDGAAALCWISAADGYFFGDNAGSGTVSSFTETSGGAPTLVNATAATAHPGTTDSAVSPDGDFLYVESGGSGTIDVYAIGTSGTLTQIETIFNLPIAAEGIAAS